ncbi:hypothetical protein [Ramlibacter sp.]|uniref:hypothetical protein n=1 Tax=Ramlibacter sp. TaxID=1917967 RepID=UPI002626155C|nr:hypothetical protein [Ramlibacter sp.]
MELLLQMVGQASAHWNVPLVRGCQKPEQTSKATVVVPCLIADSSGGLILAPGLVRLQSQGAESASPQYTSSKSTRVDRLWKVTSLMRWFRPTGMAQPRRRHALPVRPARSQSRQRPGDGRGFLICEKLRAQAPKLKSIVFALFPERFAPRCAGEPPLIADARLGDQDKLQD